MSGLPKKTILYKELKLAQEAGAQFEFPAPYISMTEEVLQELHESVFGVQKEAVDPGASAAWDAATAAVSGAPDPVPVPHPNAPTAPAQGQSGAEKPLRDRPEDWVQYAPETLARLLNIPFKDMGADRAGLTFNTHGPNDPLRVDSLGRVWYLDEVMKPAIPKARMVRKVKTISHNVVEHQTKRADGGLDETFEVAGQEKHEIESKVTLPSSQVGVYRDPRFPFKIHQYGGIRGFDHDAVRDYYGGLDLIPARIREKTIYIGTDLCYDINAVRETIEQEYREKFLGRGNY